jgi:hypothetical protein
MAVSETRVTRGRLLKRAGVGAAAVGAGSMLTASTASAAAHPSPECSDPAGAAGCTSCPACNNLCPGGSGCCCCFVTVEGCCFCAENTDCNVPSCTSSSQCPPGWACVATCCDATPRCVPHCGATSPHVVCDSPSRNSPRVATTTGWR